MTAGTTNLNIKFYYSNTPTNNLSIKAYRNQNIPINGIAFYGYVCTSGYFLHDSEFVCHKCPNYCANCNPTPTLTCSSCPVNFVLVANSSCTCPLPKTIWENMC